MPLQHLYFIFTFCRHRTHTFPFHALILTCWHFLSFTMLSPCCFQVLRHLLLSLFVGLTRATPLHTRCLLPMCPSTYTHHSPASSCQIAFPDPCSWTLLIHFFHSGFAPACPSVYCYTAVHCYYSLKADFKIRLMFLCPLTGHAFVHF